MSERRCIVPVVIQLRGLPDDERLTEMSDAITRTVASRLLAADRAIAVREGWSSWHRNYASPEIRFSGALLDDDLRRRVAAAIQAGIARALAGGPGAGALETPLPPFALAQYSLPASAPAAPVRRTAPPRRHHMAHGWQVLRSRDFYTTIGEYVDFFDSVGDSPTELGNLYTGMADQQQRVSLWLVQVDRAYRKSDLARELSTRATELSLLRGDQTLFWVLGLSEPHRKQLIRIDRSGIAEQTITDLAGNSRYFSTVRGEAYVLRGARVFLTAMVLPQIRLADYVRLEPEIQLSLRYRDLEFLISTMGFESRFHVSWAGFLGSYGDRETTLHILRMEVRRRAPWETIDALVEQATHVNAQQEDTRKWWRLEPLNRSFLNALPDVVRQAVAAYADRITLALSDSDRWSPWQPGWRAAILWASFQVTADQRFAINNQATARRTADRLVAHLSAFDDKLVWWLQIGQLFTENFNIYRAPEGIRTIFDLVMEELETREGGHWLNILLDILDANKGNATRIFLGLAFFSTNYNNHPRIVAMRGRINTARRESLRNSYFPDTNAIWLDKDIAKCVPKGGVVADADASYSEDQEAQLLVEPRRAAFEKALDREGNKLVEEIVKGRTTQDFDVTEFTNKVVARAARSIHLTNDDFEKVTVTISARVTKVELITKLGLEHYAITWNYVKRIDNGQWQDIPGSERTSNELEFEGQLFAWQLGQTGKLIERVSLVIVGIGVIAIAWEAGLVALLVDLAGGTTAILSAIALSEIIYLVTAKKITLEGFVMAAIDGYLYALTFRFAGIGGRAIATRIGTSSITSLVGGWVAERLFTGIVGGASGGALTVFAHGVAGVLLGNSKFPTLGDFVRGMTMGAVMGLVGEFVIGPALQTAFRIGGQTALDTIGEAVKLIRDSSTSPARYAALVGEALGALRQRLQQFLEETSVANIMTPLRERLAAIGEALENVPGAVKQRFELALFRRIFEIAEVGLGHLETGGLERLLAATEAGATHMSRGELLFFLNGLARDRVQTQRVLQGLGRLAEDQVSALIVSGQLDAVAGANHLLRNLVMHDVDLVWGVWKSGSFGFRIGDFEAWLGRISHYADDQQVFGLEVLRRPDQLITPEGIAQALDKGGLTNDSVIGLDRLYGAVNDPAVADAIMTGVARDNAQAYLLFLGRENAKELAAQGFLQPLSTVPRVLAFASRGENLKTLQNVAAIRAANRGNVPEVVQGLEEFFTREPALTSEQQVAVVRQLPNILGAARGRYRRFSEIETLRTITQRAREAGIGNLEQGVAIAGRLISDNVDPRVARVMLTAPPGTNVTAVQVPGPGVRGPDVLFETPAGSIGREAVTVTPQNFRPATARSDIRDRIVRGTTEKVNRFGDNFGDDRPAARPNYLLREIDVQIRRASDGNTFDAVLDETLFRNVMDEVRRRSPYLGLISRVRFYDSTGTLIFTWTP